MALKYMGVASIPVDRISDPDEIAEAVCYLVSSDAAFVSGATIDINGGMYMR
ncbi:SDR family oxidoreductase [Paraburkholderia sp. SG-MS1]|uniref:SDR family oxidoreductase n=1 Tax=Paraburkholderia sp. SG-MS1 TaxID=2023741 RepID=UPI00313A11D7